MREFTIRNKATNPIVTFVPATLNRLLAARPESTSLVIAKLQQDYKRTVGKPLSIDSEQRQQVLARAGANAAGMWTSRYAQIGLPLYAVVTCFTAGFLNQTLSSSIAKDLEVAEAFYTLLDTRLETATV